MALIVPKADAKTGKHESSASKVMVAINRFDIFIPRRNLRRVPVFVGDKEQTGALSRRKIRKK
jgi:hypothetical protein